MSRNQWLAVLHQMGLDLYCDFGGGDIRRVRRGGEPGPIKHRKYSNGGAARRLRLFEEEQQRGRFVTSALPAPLIDVVTPSAPMAHCEGEGHREVTDNTPPRLYRPPIS